MDSDDGSSWFEIHHNFIYGEGLKMDYGGHDSSYHHNVNVVHPMDGQQCINTWAFGAKGNAPCAGSPGVTNGTCSHAHLFFNNTCALLADVVYGTSQQISCEAKEGGFNPGAAARMTRMHDNAYYTPNGTARLKCPDKTAEVPLAFLQSGGVELGSTAAVLPPDVALIQWGREVLVM